MFLILSPFLISWLVVSRSGVVAGLPRWLGQDCSIVPWICAVRASHFNTWSARPGFLLCGAIMTAGRDQIRYRWFLRTQWLYWPAPSLGSMWGYPSSCCGGGGATRRHLTISDEAGIWGPVESPGQQHLNSAEYPERIHSQYVACPAVFCLTF